MAVSFCVLTRGHDDDDNFNLPMNLVINSIAMAGGQSEAISLLLKILISDELKSVTLTLRSRSEVKCFDNLVNAIIYFLGGPFLP